MKKLFLTLIVVLACFSSAFAQGYLGVNPNNYESNWPDFDYHDYLSQEPFVAAIAIDGQVVTLENANWSDLEVAAFVTTAEGQEECRSNLMWLTDEYVIEYGDPYLTIDGFPIYYNTVGGTVYFKMHDHANNIDYTECTITYLDEPYTVTAGLEVGYGWGDGEPPVILNFTTPSANCDPIVLNAENGYEKSWDFDNYTTAAGPWTGVTPVCWTVAEQYFHGSEIYTDGEDTLPQVYRPIHPENYVTSGNYSLRMMYRVLLAMPELDESVDMSRLRLSMNVSQTQTFYKLQVGVMDDPTDESTFVPVAVVNNPESDVMLPFECGFTNYTGTGRYIAFKNVGGSTVDPYSGNFLDDVVLSYADSVECNGITDLPHTEDFDDYTSNTGLMGVQPDCWELVDAEVDMDMTTVPQLYYNPEYSTSGNYTLRLKNRGVYAMPELALADATKGIKDLKLTFQLRQPSSIYRLQVGVVESDGTFTVVQEIKNADEGFAEVTVNFSSYAGNGKRIAFRNVLRNSAQYDYSYNFIDDIELDYNNVSCAIDNSYSENFDGYTQTTEALTGVAPDCWEVISEDVALTDVTRPQLYYNPDYAESGSYTLRLKNRCVYAMPEFAEGVNVGNLSMTFSLRQPSSIYRLQVGVVDAEGAFTMVEEIKNEGRGFEEHTVDFTGYEGVRIAFRNVLRNSAPYDYSYNFIDNINLAPSAKKSEFVEGGVNDAMDADRYLNNIVVYPNPTTGNLYIDAVDVQKVECYNQMGQLVGVYDNANELNISDLSNGVYMLRITVPQGVTMRKVVKK